MKLLVSTVGSFMYVDPQTGDELAHNRPSVVRNSNFVQSFTAAGKVKVHANDVLDTATDQDFQAFWKESEGDSDLAVSAFLSKFSASAAEADATDAELAAQAAAQKAADDQQAAVAAAALDALEAARVAAAEADAREAAARAASEAESARVAAAEEAAAKAAKAGKGKN